MLLYIPSLALNYLNLNILFLFLFCEKILGGVPWQAYYQRVLAFKTPSHARYISLVAAFGCFSLSIPAYVMGAVGASTSKCEVYIKNMTLWVILIGECRR